MCYDIALFTSIKLVTDYLPALKDKFSGQLNVDFTPTDHMQAQRFQPWPTVLKENGELKVRMFEWGVVADYMDTPQKIEELRPLMANARSEKIFLESSYWNRIRHQRCVIPVNGFYEHREVRGFKAKIPYFIFKKDQPLFFMGCLYNYAPIPTEDGEQVGTFAVVMEGANDKIKTIHNTGDNPFRQPLILQNDMVDDWLDPDLPDTKLKRLLNYQITSEEVDAWPVFSVRTDIQRPDKKDKHEPYVYKDLPPLGQDTKEKKVEQTSLF